MPTRFSINKVSIQESHAKLLFSHKLLSERKCVYARTMAAAEQHDYPEASRDHGQSMLLIATSVNFKIANNIFFAKNVFPSSVILGELLENNTQRVDIILAFYVWLSEIGQSKWDRRRQTLQMCQTAQRE